MNNMNLNTIESKAIAMMFPVNEKYHGNVHFATKNSNGFRSMGYADINQIVDRINDMKLYPYADYYLTANTTRTGERNTENIFSFNNIVVDIDCHHELAGLILPEALEEFEYRLQRDLYDTDTIPPHNILVRTGRGIQLWWCINQIPSELGWLYDHAQNSLILAIKDLIAEYSGLEYLSVDDGASSNKIGFYRMPATIHSMTGKPIETYINTETRYDVNELTPYFFEMKKEQHDEIERTPVFDKTFRVLHHQRMEHIMNLAEEKAEHGIIEGYRDQYAWLYYNACYQVFSEETADKMLDELNNVFIVPLKECELRAIRKYIQNKGGLRMKQSTFYELLGEEPTVKTRAMIREEKRRAKVNRNNKIKQLYNQGMSVKEIMEEMNISKPTVLSVLKIKAMRQNRNDKIIAEKKGGASLNLLATKFNLSIKTIKRIVKDVKESIKEKVQGLQEQMTEYKEQLCLFVEQNTTEQIEKETEPKERFRLTGRLPEDVGWT